MCVRLDLLPELGRRGLVAGRVRVGEGVAELVALPGQVKVEVPCTDDAIATAGVAVKCQRRLVSWGGGIAAYRMEFAGSTAKPFTPSRCPPAEFARGRTAVRNRRQG
jgi:hypothetical protein